MKLAGRGQDTADKAYEVEQRLTAYITALGQGQLSTLGGGDQLINNAGVNTFVTWTSGITPQVSVGRYRVRALIHTVQGSVNATQTVGFAGTATVSNASLYYWSARPGTTPANALIFIARMTGVLPLSLTYDPGGATITEIIWIEGDITVSAAGTFRMFGNNAVGASFTIKDGTFMSLVAAA